MLPTECISLHSPGVPRTKYFSKSNDRQFFVEKAAFVLCDIGLLYIHNLDEKISTKHLGAEFLTWLAERIINYTHTYTHTHTHKD